MSKKFWFFSSEYGFFLYESVDSYRYKCFINLSGFDKAVEILITPSASGEVWQIIHFSLNVKLCIVIHNYDIILLKIIIVSLLMYFGVGIY